MGLMNVGKGEGAQIQLFGRGVRLKGFDLGLKRSGKTQLSKGVERPKHIGVLETLGILGIHANYMAQFRDFLAGGRNRGKPGEADVKFHNAIFIASHNELLKKMGATIRMALRSTQRITRHLLPSVGLPLHKAVSDSKVTVEVKVPSWKKDPRPKPT